MSENVENSNICEIVKTEKNKDKLYTKVFCILFEPNSIASLTVDYCITGDVRLDRAKELQ